MPSSALQAISHCDKNSNHKDFIAVDDFKASHLTAVHQSQELFDLIQCHACLTVKVITSFIAQKNPKKVKRRQCSGFVIWVGKKSGLRQSCRCDKCVATSSIEPDSWYEFLIITNASHISSQKEADRTTLEFYFKRNGEDGKLKSLKGGCRYIQLNKNICQLHYKTFDDNLGQELLSHFIQFEELVSKACTVTQEKRGYLFSVTVSHPHGCEKHVTFSFERNLFESFGGHNFTMNKNVGFVMWPSSWNFAKVYNIVPTCKGSSGAVILTLTRERGIVISLHHKTTKRISWVKDVNVRHFRDILEPDEDGEPDVIEELGPVFPEAAYSHKKIKQNPDAVKASSPSETSGKDELPPSGSASSVNGSLPSDGGQCDEKALPDNGESQVCIGPEAHLQLLYYQCEKNPNHTNFIHLDELSLDHLPEGHQSQTLLDNLRLAAALTVKIKTKYVSRIRPQFHPHTGSLYHSYQGKGMKFLRTGTGFVISSKYHEIKYGQKCHCSECITSGEIRHDCYQLVVMSATHVVFDQAEANRTEIEFSYFQSKGDVKTKVLKGKCNHSVINEDVCWLEFSYHDQSLHSILKDTLLQFQKGRLELVQSDLNDSLVAIISHPHGSRKQHISFGSLILETEMQSKDVDESVPPKTQSKGADESVPPKTQSMDVDESVPPKTQSKGVDESVPPKSQSMDVDESVPPKTQSKGADESVPPKSQSKGVDESVPIKTQSEGADESVSPKTQSMDVDESVPPKTQSEGADESVSPKTQSKSLVESVPPKTQSMDVDESVPPKTQSEGADESVPPKTQSKSLVESVPPKTLSKGVDESIAPETQSMDVNESVPPKTQSKSLDESVAPKTQSKSLVESVPPKTQSKSVDESISPKTQSKSLVESVPPKTQSKSLVASVPPKTLSKGVDESIAPETQSMDVNESVPPKTQSRSVDESISPKTQSKSLVESVPPKTHSKGVDESVPPNMHALQEQSVLPNTHALQEQSVLPNTHALQEHSVLPNTHALQEQSVLPKTHALEDLSDSLKTQATDIKAINRIVPRKVEARKIDKPKGEEKPAHPKLKKSADPSEAFKYFHPFEKIAIWPGDFFRPVICKQFPKVSYTTPTCPGSSGALVLIHKPGEGVIVHTHWGCDEAGTSCNRSGGGTMFFGNPDEIYPS